jgi:dihydroneopterin aldolase
MDKIFIKQLGVFMTIGVHAWEQSIRQKLLIDLEVSWPTQKAGAADDYQQTLCYAAIAERLEAKFSAQPCALIETVAEQTAQLILHEFGAPRVQVTVEKPSALPQAQTVGVTIVREAL